MPIAPHAPVREIVAMTTAQVIEYVDSHPAQREVMDLILADFADVPGLPDELAAWDANNDGDRFE